MALVGVAAERPPPSMFVQCKGYGAVLIDVEAVDIAHASPLNLISSILLSLNLMNKLILSIQDSLLEFTLTYPSTSS